MGTDPLSSLSVVLPNYNHARYLRQALDAILKQSLQPREIIVVDDASTDNSVEIIEEYARKHPSIVLVRNPRNSGVSVAVNRGIERATSEYLHLSAADDMVLPGLYEKSMRLLAQHPQAGLCSTMALLIDEEGKTLGPYHTPVISKTECFLTPREALDRLRASVSWLVTHSIVFKRRALIEEGMYIPELKHAADGYLINVIAARHGACFIPEPLVAWRKAAAGYATIQGSNLDSAFQVLNKLAQRLGDTGLFPPEYLQKLKRWALIIMMHETTRTTDRRSDRLLEIAEQLPANTWDKLFLAILRLSPGLGWRWSKLYLFFCQPWRDQVRIFAHKIKLLLGRGTP